MKKNFYHALTGHVLQWSAMLKSKSIFIILTLSALTILQTASFAQTKKVTVNFNNVPLEDVLDQLSTSSRIDFIYNSDLISSKGRVSLKADDKELGILLREFLPRYGLEHTYDERTVVIREAPQRLQTGNQPLNATITGQVVDSDGRPVVGASVVLKSSPTTGTSTDVNGRFSLRIPDARNATFVFSYLGKKSVEANYTGRAFRIVLEDDAADIEDVVITGIFTRARESYTGAVTTITSAEIQTHRGQNLIQTLRNIDPSINLMINNELGSNPNAVPQMTIRGNSTLPMSVDEYNTSLSNEVNTPLIVMDGFEISLTKLMDYNDDEIESINILKDASATAIYGSRGSNGVIVVVSKAPKPGKLRVNFQAGLSLEFPDLSSYDMLNAWELLQLQNRVGLYNETSAEANSYRQEAYQARLKDVLEGADTDWLHYPVRTGVTQRYNVRLEGGSEEFRWGTTLGYNKTQGAMKGSYRDNFNGGITLSYSYKNLIFRNQLNIGLNKGVESPYGTFSTYVNMQPYYMPYDKDGNLVKEFVGFTVRNPNLQNPLYDATLDTKNESKYTEIINNFSIEWKIRQELTLRGKFGISKKNSESDHFLPPDHSTFLESEYQTDEGFFRKGKYTFGTGNDVNYEGSLNASYSKAFNDKHQVYAGVDLSIRSADNYFYTIVTEGYPEGTRGFFGNALLYDQTDLPSGTESTVRTVGFTGNFNYTYDNRYYADFSYRVDGSSQFGSDKRYAPFWSAGVGWSIHRESFLKDSDVVNNLRLRTSYGQTGSQNFSAYQAVMTYQFLKDDKYLNHTGSRLMALGNKDLKWQTTDQFNAGIDMGLFQGRLNATFDYYVKTTKDLLSSMELPRSTGYSSYVSNIGTVRNNGFETSLSGYVIRNSGSGLIWLLTAKMAYNKNKIIKLSEAIKEQSEEYKLENVDMSTLFYEGYSQQSIWAVRSLGIDPSTGNELFYDPNGNITTVWHAAAKVYCGVSEPRFRGNAGSMLRYRNFTLNLTFGYHWGGQVYNSTLLNKVEVTTSTIRDQNVDRRVLEARWANPGDISTFKKISEEATRATSRFVMDERVFELQSASLQYRIDNADFLKRSGIQSVLISVESSDLFYFSSVKRERGTSYPFARRVGFSLGLTF